MTAVQFLSKCYPCNYLLDSTGGSIYDGVTATVSLNEVKGLPFSPRALLRMAALGVRHPER